MPNPNCPDCHGRGFVVQTSPDHNGIARRCDCRLSPAQQREEKELRELEEAARQAELPI